MKLLYGCFRFFFFPIENDLLKLPYVVIDRLIRAAGHTTADGRTAPRGG
jgi:hypothetical protein